MNRLIEIWYEKGMPLRMNMKEYDSVIHELQQKLNDIYAAFTGDYAAGEISQIGVGRDSENSTEEDSIKPVEGFSGEHPSTRSTPRAPRGLFST